MVTDTAASLTSNIAIALSTVVAMFIIDWRLTLLSLGLLPFFMYLTYRVGKVNREVRGETQKSLAEMSAATEETLSVSGMLLSKTFGQQQTAIDRFSKLNRQLATLQVRQAMVGRWFFMIIGTIFSITPAFVYWLAGYLAIQNDPTAPTIGDIVAFTTLQSRLFFPLGQLLNVQVEIQGALALFDRIFEYLELDPGDRRRARRRRPRRPRRSPAGSGSGTCRSPIPTPPPRDEAPEAADAPAMARPPRSAATAPRRAAAAALEPEPLPFGLRDIDFEAAPGDLVALVGPSGSGKTTTTYLVPRLYDVAEGAVEIDGIDVRKLSLVSLGPGHRLRDPGDVPVPRHRPGEPPVRQARAPRRTSSKRPRGRRRSTIGSWTCPQGYDTIVGERGYKLSGGEKQRIAIARVLLKDPRILILDEATSALDTVSERLIQRALEQLERGRTTIAIAHRLSTILRADQILVYDGGRIVERGTHASLLERGGLYARLYHEQFELAGGDGGAAARGPVGEHGVRRRR